MSGGWGATKATAKRKARDTSSSEHGNKYNGYSYRFAGVEKQKITSIPSSILLEGYPPGLMINVVGPPKSGKTKWCLHEAISLSISGEHVLYMYNERGRDRFDYTVDNSRKSLGVPVNSLRNIEFRDMSTVISNVAQRAAIHSFITKRYVKPIEDFLMRVDGKMIVIDSLSKAIRTFPAQAYWAVQTLTDGISDVMRRTKRNPVILLINQKSGGSRERNDESVLGGYGCVHDMDGNIVLRMNTVDKWLAKDTGLRIGSVYHTVQVMEIRDTHVNTDERLVEIVDGRLTVGMSISELVSSHAVKMAKISGKIVVNKQWSELK